MYKEYRAIVCNFGKNSKKFAAHVKQKKNSLEFLLEYHHLKIVNKREKKLENFFENLPKMCGWKPPIVSTNHSSKLLLDHLGPLPKGRRLFGPTVITKCRFFTRKIPFENENDDKLFERLLRNYFYICFYIFGNVLSDRHEWTCGWTEKQ